MYSIEFNTEALEAAIKAAKNWDPDFKCGSKFFCCSQEMIFCTEEIYEGNTEFG